MEERSEYKAPTMCDLMNLVVAEIPGEWNRVGIQLEISTKILDGIKSDISLGGDPRNFFQKTLEIWKESPKVPYRWETILKALASPSVNQVKLSKSISQKLKMETEHEEPRSCVESEVDSLLKGCSEENSEDVETESNSSGYYTEDTLKCLCGCGECSLEKIITEGCSHPGSLQRFPLLDITKLPKAKLQQYLYMLTKEAEIINYEFASLCDELCESLTRREISVHRLINFLKNYKCFAIATRKTELHQKLDNSHTTEEVFTVLSEICSWFNHHPVGALVKQFGSDDDKKAYDKFTNETLKTYLKRSVTEIPKDSFGPEDIEGSGKFKLKVDSPFSHKNISGEQILLLTGKVADALDIPIEDLTISSISRGCLEIVFLVPQKILDNLLLSEKLNALREIIIEESQLKVKSIMFGDCHYGMPLSSLTSNLILDISNSYWESEQLQNASAIFLDVQSVDAEFAYLITYVAQSLCAKNVNLDAMKKYLHGIEAFKARTSIKNPKPILDSILRETKSSETILEVFMLLSRSRFWSWFDYRLFEKVVLKFGSQEETSILNKYKVNYNKLLERELIEMLCFECSMNEKNGFTKLKIKLAEKMRGEKINLISRIQERFARLLELETHSLILSLINIQTAELHFFVPEEVTQLFPLATETMAEISNVEYWPICHITCGDNDPQYLIINTEEDYTYNARQYDLVEETPDDDKESGSSQSSDSGIRSLDLADTHSVQSETNSEISQSENLGLDLGLQMSKSISTATLVKSCSTLSVSDSDMLSSGNTNLDLETSFVKDSETVYKSYNLGIENIEAQQKPIEEKYKGIHWVCQACLLHNPCNESLFECTCCNTTMHNGVFPIVSVAWNGNEHMLVQIRPLPQLSLLRGFALCDGNRCKGESYCTYAHSELEKMAWNYEVNLMNRGSKAISHLPKIPPPVNRKNSYQFYNRWKENFKNRVELTELNDNDLEPNLTVDNYQDKFYTLLCFEEMEHISLLTNKCDGHYEFVLFKKVPKLLTKLPYESLKHVGYLQGITGDQVAYAAQSSQSSEGLFFVDSNGIDICKANILSFNYNIAMEKKMYVSFSDDEMEKFHNAFELDSKNSCLVDVEFEVKHGFFDTLHKSIINLPHYMILKLIPKLQDFQTISMTLISDECKHECLQLNYGCQLEALTTIVSSSSRVPVLVSGPFGCGKTRILARAAYEFVENGLKSHKVTRILICAHHPASIQTYITDYFSNICASDRNWKQKVKVLKIARGKSKFDRKSHEYFCNIPTFHREIFNGQYQNEKCLIIVTTYMTSMQLYYILKRPGGFFTHILLDEAAQVREPEAVAPLCLAVYDSKVVVAGDSKQVGPALVVLGKQAHEKGLAISLLERLESHYKYIGDSALCYHNVVADNYRCNESIARFLSTVFYNRRINTHTFVDVHPRASFPFIFYCCDIERVVRAPQESAFEVEADAVLKQLDYYLDKSRRPRDWRTYQFSVITPTRNQVNLIRQKLNDQGIWKKVHVLPTYVIQGHEFRAIFLCTSEPLEQNGSSMDPLKSLCNPYVFNTAISRAKSLVVAVGNPFMLLKIEETMKSQQRCWKEYLRICLKKGTVFLPENYDDVSRRKVIVDLHNAVEMQVQKSSPLVIEPPSNPSKRLEKEQSQKLSPAPQTQDPTNTKKMSYAEVVASTQKDPLKHQVKQSSLLHQKTNDELPVLVSSSDSEVDSDDYESRIEYFRDIGFL